MTFHRLKVCTLTLFLLLSAVDLGLTIVILRLGGARFYESNPFARWALAQAGWLGITWYKTVSVMAVTGCCSFIASWRPQLGNRILAFACALLVAVVGYSSALAGTSGIFCPHARERYHKEIEEKAVMLKEKLVDTQGYAKLYRHVWNELLANRLPISEAAQTLAGYAESHQSDWILTLRERYSGLPLQICLEKYLQSCLETTLSERLPLLSEG
jgi:uncharacterized protein DUF5658